MPEINQTDEELLAELAQGRCTPGALADWTDVSTGTIHRRLNVLVAAGMVEKVHRGGLYRITDAGREEVGEVSDE